MNRRPITLPTHLISGLVVVLVRNASEVEVQHPQASIHHALALEEPPPVFQHLINDLADKARNSLVIAVVPTQAKMFSLDFTVSNARFLKSIAADLYWEDGAGGFATIKQTGGPRLTYCRDDTCNRGAAQGLPEYAAVSRHEQHGGLWRESFPLSGLRSLECNLRCSPTQAGAIEYFHAGEWKFCAEPGWSRGCYVPLVRTV